jgi:hypothetical protein
MNIYVYLYIHMYTYIYTQCIYIQYRKKRIIIHTFRRHLEYTFQRRYYMMDLYY